LQRIRGRKKKKKRKRRRRVVTRIKRNGRRRGSKLRPRGMKS